MIRMIFPLALPLALIACAPVDYGYSKTSNTGSTSASGSYYPITQGSASHNYSTHNCANPCAPARPNITGHNNASGWHTGRVTDYNQPAYSSTITQIYPAGQSTAAPRQLAQNHAASATNAPAYGGQHIPQLRPKKDYTLYGNFGAGTLSTSDDVYGVVGRFGIESGYWGAEIEGATDVNKSTSDVVFDASTNPVNGELDVGVDYLLAAYGVGKINVLRGTNAFVRAGYHTTKVTGTGRPDGLAERRGSKSVDGFALGTGFEVNLGNDNALRFDATGYEFENNDWSRSYTASYSRRF